MSWRSFNKKDVRVLLLRLRKGRLMLSQHEHEHEQEEINKRWKGDDNKPGSLVHLRPLPKTGALTMRSRQGLQGFGTIEQDKISGTSGIWRGGTGTSASCIPPIGTEAAGAGARAGAN